MGGAAPACVPPAAPVDAAALGRLARRALEDEARLSPKPGLVDALGSGAHADLDLSLMLRSAAVIEPYFAAMARAGAASARCDAALRRRVGRLGREAEAAMMAATAGVNTHRGAIWALGLLATAAGHLAARLPSAGVGDIAAQAGQLARLPDPGAPARTGHKGERACLAYGVGGAREQARNGFPAIVQAGWPALSRSRAAGGGEACARLDALLAILAVLDDTCVLARCGMDTLRLLQQQAARVLAEGGTARPRGRIHLHVLLRTARTHGASPGGAADLLAATLFLDSVAHFHESGKEMETHTFSFPAGRPAAGRVVVGVVGSGDLEVMVEPCEGARADVTVTTSVDGGAAIWRAQLERLFERLPPPAARIDIHDFGATPGVVGMRLAQALAEGAA